MKKFCFLSTLVLFVLLGKPLIAQDFSNKGKEFWLAYSYHVGMTGGGTPVMTLYITSDVATAFKVEIFGVTTIFAGNLTPNQVVPVQIPNNYFINDDGVFNGRAIRVTGDKPIVVYSFITRSQASAATLCLPTTVLGKEYYSASFTQISNENNANSYITIVGVEDNTTVEIIPTGQTKGNWTPNSVNIITLNKGQVYQVLGQTTGNSGVDLTGTRVRSISSSTGACKRIAVFSGSGKISIGCNGSSDNLYQQLYPVASWGKKYLTVPSYNRPNTYYRIMRSDPASNVYVNGTLVPPTSFNNNYYEFLSNRGNIITSDIPISVTQYFTTQNCAGNGSPYDPDMIVLNPVEQNINKVTLVNSPLTVGGAHEHHIHLIMPNGGTGQSSFTLDGVPVPSSAWTQHSDPNYSYLYLPFVNSGNHTLYSDSGFNALAYGYGNAETYGYSAGTNVKDIYQYVSIQNQYATVNFPATCKNTPFNFSMTFPYQPMRIQWIFNGLFPDVDITNPVFTSTTVVNGKTLYQYSLTGTYTIPTAGTYPIKVIAQNPTPDGCGGEQEINYDLVVFDPPVANFNFSTNGCLTSPVSFSDLSNGNGRTINNWYWNFGDGNTNTTVNNPTHTYTAAGPYTVKYAIRTDVGCISDTAIHVVTLSDPPVAKFGYRTPNCAGKLIIFSDTSSVPTGSTLSKWTWDFGDGSPVVVANTNIDQPHTYSTAGTYTVTLRVETAAGCVSPVFSRQITINSNPVVDFSMPTVCLPSGAAQFNDLSTVGSGVVAGWNWDFGDGNTSTAQNPLHTYTGTGPFTVTLTVTSSLGCVNTVSKVLTSIYAEPQAAFTNTPSVCLGGTVVFTDQSTATGSSVTQWNWNFGDGNTSTLQNPTHVYAAPGTYTVTLSVGSAIGCQSVTNVATHTVQVNTLPTVSFTNPVTLCESTDLVFTSTSVSNGGVFSQYSWTVNGNPAGGNNPVLTYNAPAPGTYTIVLTATTSTGCTNSSSSTITVNAKPLASFNLPSICLPTGIANFISTSTVSGGTIVNYNWDFGDGNTSTSANPSHTYTGTGPFNVRLTVTSNNGCTDDSLRLLNTIYAEPQAAFTAPAEVCHGSAVSFTDGSTATGSSVTQWNWTFGDGNTSTVQNPTHTYAAPGTYTVTLSIGSAAGCQTVNNIATRTVVVNALPSANFNTSLPSCATRDIVFTDVSSPNSGTLNKWTWDYGDATTAVLTSAAPFAHRYNAAGSYVVTLSVENNKGCISPVVTKTISVNVLPKAGFIPPIACRTDASSFTDTSKINGGTITAWQWNFGDPNANAGNPNTSTAQNPTHQYTVAGTYTATLVAISNQGCTDTTRTTFVINGSVPLANFNIQSGNSICSNKNISITDASSVDVGTLIRTEIYWDYSNDPTIKLVDNTPSSGEVYSHTYPEFGTPASKTITIRYVVYSGTTCLSSQTKTINLLATPTLQFADVPPVCEDVSPFQVTQVQLVNSLPGTGVYTGRGISPTGVFNPATAGPGAHIITYTYTGANGCVNTVSNDIEVNPKPGVNAGPDKFILQGGSVTLTPAVNAGSSVTYTWTPGTGLSNPAIANPVASPADDITYMLTVKTDKNCSASDNVFVKVLKAPIIPNIFSPNGDNVHDKWVIPYLESYPGCTIDIYNRYGQLVLHTVGYPVPWDGKVNGKDVPVGTYYYVIDPKNGRTKMAGYVDVIR